MLLLKTTINDTFTFKKCPPDFFSALNWQTPDNHLRFVGIYFGNTLKPEIIQKNVMKYKKLNP